VVVFSSGGATIDLGGDKNCEKELLLSRRDQAPIPRASSFGRSSRNGKSWRTRQIDIGNMSKAKSDKATKSLAEEPHGYEFLGP
jgi:hypothetical protein